MSEIHYSGGVTYSTRGRVTRMVRGFPACCSGPRAKRIAAEGNQTEDELRVTCGTCRRRLGAQQRERLAKAIKSIRF